MIKKILSEIHSKSEKWRHICLIYIPSNSESTKEQVPKAGLKVFVMMYGWKPTDRLNQRMYNYFTKNSAGGLKFIPNELQQTEKCASTFTQSAYADSIVEEIYRCV